MNPPVFPPISLSFHHAPEFPVCVGKAHVRIRVERDRDVGMPHDVLEGLGVDAAHGHVRTERVPANVRRDLGHGDAPALHVLLPDEAEDPGPLHARQRHTVPAHEEEAALPVDDRLHLEDRPVGDQPPEAGAHVVRHRDLPDAAGGLGCRNVVAGLPVPQELVIDGDFLLLQVNVGGRQAGELGDTQSGVEQGVDGIVVPAVICILLDERQVRPLLFHGQRLPKTQRRQPLQRRQLHPRHQRQHRPQYTKTILKMATPMALQAEAVR